jgi:AraC-like DNA-binding protein
VRDDIRRTLLAGDPPVGPSQWQQRVGGFTRLPALLRELGVEPERVLAEAGLPPGAFDAPDRSLPYAGIGRALEVASARARCPHLGVLLGRTWRLEDLGVVGVAVRHAPTIGDALRTLAVHQHLNSGGGLAYLIEGPTHVDFGYAIYHPAATGTYPLFDTALAAGVQFLRELGGDALSPPEVSVPHARPADARPYVAHFRVGPVFDAAVAALRFPAAWMQRPVVAADAARRAAALRQIGARQSGELVPRAMRALRLLMLNGDVSGEGTARMLAMHRRTLNRRLKAQGTTFQFVLDRVRFDAARQLLEGTRLTLEEIARALGYASVSPFMRSFRRWTGVTPGQWRRDAAARPPAPRVEDVAAAA